MGSIREVAISRSVSSRTMSAADRPRSWRSANKDKCRDHGSSKGGPKARKNVRHCGRDRSRSKARKQMQICSNVGIDQRNGPQSRAKTCQTDEIGGENGAGADVTGIPRAVTHGQVTHGQ